MKKVFGIFIILVALLLVSGCDNAKVGGKNSIVGAYELYEVQAGSEKWSRKEWIDLSTMDMILAVKSDKTLIYTKTYKNSSTNKTETIVEYYTYDDKYLYGTNNKGTQEGVKYYSYEYKNGLLKLTVIDDNHNSIYIFKQN